MREGENFGLVFDLIVAMQEARAKTSVERSKSTPYETAVAEVSEENELKEDTLKGIYKRSKGKGD